MTLHWYNAGVAGGPAFMLFSSKIELVMLVHQHSLAELSVSRPAVCTQVVFRGHRFYLHISLLNTLMMQRKNNIKFKKYDLLNYMISRKDQHKAERGKERGPVGGEEAVQTAESASAHRSSHRLHL